LRWDQPYLMSAQLARPMVGGAAGFNPDQPPSQP